MRAFKVILSNQVYTSMWVLFIRKAYGKTGWKIKGINIQTGAETETKCIDASDLYTAITVWASVQPDNMNKVTAAGEIKF